MDLLPPKDLAQQQAELRRKLLQTGIVSMPGSVMLGLGLFGTFAEIDAASAMHMFADATLSGVLLVAGSVIEAWAAFRIYRLSNAANAIQQQPSTDRTR